MDDVQYAVSHIILSALYNDKKLQIRDPPMDHIKDICIQIRKVVESWLTDPIPSDLPIPIDQIVSTDIYELTVSHGWKNYLNRKNVIDTPYPERIKNILKRSNIDDKDYLVHLEEELLQIDENSKEQFINELEKLEGEKLTERLDNWSGYELLDLFDKVGQMDVKILIGSPQKKVTNEMSGFNQQFKQQANYMEYYNIRKKWINKFTKLYEKYGNPDNYPKHKKDIDQNYIEKKLLPFIIYT